MFQNIKYQKLIATTIHISIWLLLILLPLLLFYDREIRVMMLLEHSWIPLVYVAIIFYINYLFLLDRYLFKKKYLLFILINLVLITILLLVNYEVRQIFQDVSDSISRHGKPDDDRPRPTLLFFIIKDVSSFIIALISALALKALQRWFLVEKDRKEYENQKLNSELQHLRYQIQPHFFFNSLNNIYSLIEISATDAQKAIHSLSKLMRYMLYEAADQKVDLRSEIDFLQQYNEIMALRLNRNVKVNYIFPKVETGKYFIEPLLFIPLIENAYKHGISPSESSEVYFKMSLINNRLRFESSNSYFPKSVSDKSGSGIGLENLHKRLQILYPNHHLISQEIADGFFKIFVEIPVTKGGESA